MPITTTCPGCQALFRLPEEMAGTQVRCQKCEQLFDVPEPEASKAEAPAPAAPEEDAAPATLVEPIADKPAQRPLPKEGWAGVLVSLALLLFFSTGLCGIGAFAGIWIATHLSPPTRGVVVPPLHLDQQVKDLPKIAPPKLK